MANPGRPRIARAPRDSTFYEVRKPQVYDSDSNALGVNWPIFLVGCVAVAGAIILIRTKSNATITGPGLVVGQDYISPIEQIPNITQRLLQQHAGTYDPAGSSATYTSHPGVIN